MTVHFQHLCSRHVVKCTKKIIKLETSVFLLIQGYFQLNQLAVIRDWQWECEDQRREGNNPPSETAQTWVGFTQSPNPNPDP